MKKIKTNKSTPSQPSTSGSILPARIERALHSKPILALEVSFVVGAVAIWGAFSLFSLSPKPAVGSTLAEPTPSVSPQPAAATPSTLQRRLDGITVPVATSNYWPIGVMIENTPAARPQSGLSLAKVVIEAPAESGVIRFLALFDGSEGSAAVGPVRSARHYYVSWALGWDAIYVHAGGSPQAYAMFQRIHTWEAEALGSMARFFHRENSRPAPHNLYTSLDNLRSIRTVKKLDTTPTYAPWTFQASTVTGAATVKSISVGFDGASYRVNWSWDPATNQYLREDGGQPHIDADTGKQITATNVVVIRIGPIKSLGEKGRIDFPTLGSGDATIFHDGTVVAGRWAKDSDKTMLHFVDSSGVDIPLAPGNTWIEALPLGRPLTY